MRNICIAITGIVLLFGSIGISNVYAEELSYNEKLEFTFKIKQITGHMVSAIDSIENKQYSLAKMHLIHPMAQQSDIVDLLSQNSMCSQKLPLALTMLQHTDPDNEKQEIAKKFSYVFQILNECTELVVGNNMNSNFYVTVIDMLLEHSILTISEQSK